MHADAALDAPLMGPVMRSLLIPVLLACSALPATAAKRITVAQLEQTVSADRAAHKSDIEIARKVSSFELSERLTESTFSRLHAQFDSSSPVADALLLLADRSAFLDPPANELPATPPPDSTTQQHLLQAAQKFAIETLPRLPNLLATRTTFNFDDSPQEVVSGGYPQRLGLHLVGTSKTEVSVHSEKETFSTSAATTPAATVAGLTSWGEFGSDLLVILSDSAEGKTTWNHWEQTPSGLMAVFHYEVPKPASHYEIDTPVQEIQANGQSGRWAGRRTSDVGAVSTWTRMIRSKPAYAGSLWIDPVTGVITRVTLVADLKGNPTFERGAILVEYGPVQIADKTLIGPVRSLALSSAPPSVSATFAGAPTEWLNENLFSGYHLFASTTRILGDNTPPPASPAPAAVPSSAQSVAVAAPATPVQTSVAAASPQPAPLTINESPAQPLSRPTEAAQPPHPAATTLTSAEPAAQQTSLPSPAAAASTQTSAANTPPQPPVQPAPLPDKGLTLRVNVDALLVPVVVRDKQGNAVGDLTQQDFKILDQGKPQPITGFTVVKSAGAAEAPAASLQPETNAAPPPPHQTRFLVFLFDDRHLNSNDLALTQNAALHAIDEALTPTDYAAVVSFMGINSGVTQDHAVLKAAVMKLSIHRAFLHDTHDCPDIDYYSADRILNLHDQVEFEIAVGKVKSCDHMQAIEYASTDGIDNPTTSAQRLAVAAATRALAFGNEDARESLIGVDAVIRALGKADGQRVLVLVSPGFLTLSSDTMIFKQHLLDQALASNVIVNTLDARGLYAGNVDASQGPNVTSNQIIGSASQDQLNSAQESENALAEIANGTGGTFFHNNNDLVGGLKSLVAPPQFLYLLQISLNDAKPAGAYHRLQVKVARPGVQIQARPGYFAPAPTDKKHASR